MYLRLSLLVAAILSFSLNLSGQAIPLTIDGSISHNVLVENADYTGVHSLRVTGTQSGEQLALLKNVEFLDGTIEIDVAGKPLAGTDPSFRGFIGLAFRVRQDDSLRYECFYLRPTNGRADDQLRRNHSVQYVSQPGFPWFKLRKENPGVYESYTDLVAGEWTKIRIEVKGNEARLFVNGASQPCLIVTSLKGKIVTGQIGLWIGPGTEGYFSNLRVYKK